MTDRKTQRLEIRKDDWPKRAINYQSGFDIGNILVSELNHIDENLLHGKIFAKNCMKMKEIGSIPSPSLGSTNALFIE